MLRRFVDRPDLCNKIEEASASSVFAPPSANLGNLRDVAAEGDKARGSVRISFGHQYQPANLGIMTKVRVSLV